MASIFRKKVDQTGMSEEDVKVMIRVVKPSFWFLLGGGAIIVVALAIWMFAGWETTTVSITGVYHPTTSNYGEIICFPSITTGKQLKEGMEFSAYVTGVNQSKYGHLTGTVIYTESYIASYDELFARLEDQSMANAFYQSAPVTCIVCKLDEDPNSVSGYLWSNKNGSEIEISDGSLVTVNVVTSKERPLSLSK